MTVDLQLHRFTHLVTQGKNTTRHDFVLKERDIAMGKSRGNIILYT